MKPTSGLIKPIKFSPELMKKYGESVLTQKDNWKFFKDIWYMINWNNRKLINLQKWANANKGTLWEDKTVREFVNGLNALYPTKNHRKAIAVLRFVKKHLKYVGDTKVWNCKEYWQTPLQTWNLKTGDCEDGAILINELLRMCKIPAIQRYVRAGNVKGGGHAYCVYISELDGLEYDLDWCYWYDNAPINNRTPLYAKKNYYDAWFSFNEIKSYKEVKNPNKYIKS